jgi:hypothetical protein
VARRRLNNDPAPRPAVGLLGELPCDSDRGRPRRRPLHCAPAPRMQPCSANCPAMRSSRCVHVTMDSGRPPARLACRAWPLRGLDLIAALRPIALERLQRSVDQIARQRKGRSDSCHRCVRVTDNRPATIGTLTSYPRFLGGAVVDDVTSTLKPSRDVVQNNSGAPLQRI